ncbi:hypothetical protein [Streptomyces cinnamoneus]|uniref:DUF2283 domain-containing protein n=1 Tax=Streptomyces cinnamoneus TaxID=53446 RepID=A0A918TQ93_STRCJ|nr:hypothetical protein [Streptomyces cinnamoneus]GHC55101.1 hypothetical protein GCM10010507_34400 [Streptomyces cinnamoneus]
MSMIKPIEVDWQQETGRLHIRYEHPDGRHTRTPAHRESVPARAVLDLDEDGRLLDADIKGLTPTVVRRLAPYSCSSVTENSGPGISLDADAAWLWLHLRKGPRDRQLRGDAHVLLDFRDGLLAEVTLTLHEARGRTAEMSG